MNPPTGASPRASYLDFKYTYSTLELFLSLELLSEQISKGKRVLQDNLRGYLLKYEKGNAVTLMLPIIINESRRTQSLA